MTTTFIILFVVVFAWLKWWGKSSEASPPTQIGQPPKAGQPPKEDPQARHLRKTIEFAKAQHQTLKKIQREQDIWQRQFGESQADKLDHLSGAEFEEFLAGLLRGLGYAVELTATTGDYGADLILTKDRQRIAVQAKRYQGSVGVQAVQEALSGQAYYRCDAAWVVTTGSFTPNARQLAVKAGVKMMGRTELGKLIAQNTLKTGRG